MNPLTTLIELVISALTQFLLAFEAFLMAIGLG